ncbi:MAG: YraN family protein [Candidatus Moranbacteria bacterium CG_4_8_14_3_um_filter_34_16]|nr:MAG: YraN family protein [Candidatus Moranbacteria bacterium CG08_land_8_20_14_0_20_34_16]PIW94857.1 MAG: YraN family protein [Candidatus Moranbacteria bacterium CG_4_8_14_3_um_filter_34_16]PJA89144.1 MAG: YraN family protein [Candidatus Moranbacteria bacterium CG_4_9_14_3_um_filter_33_15]
MISFLRKKIGNIGEKVATDYLKKKGYKILDTNFQNNSGSRLGELDIVALDKDKEELVFVEVKTRNLKKFGETLPEENITYSKIRKLSKIAQYYIRQKKMEEMDFRFDAISVWLDEEAKKAKIKHIISL